MPAGSQRPRRNRATLIWVLAAAAAVVVILVLASALRPGAAQNPNGAASGPAANHNGDSAATPQAGQGVPTLERRRSGDPLAMGPVDAPVVLVEFADMRCPFCAQFERETLPVLKQKYVATGKLRIEFRNLPFYGDQSRNAAVANLAAAKQGKFWNFLNVVYSHKKFDHQDLPPDRLIQIADQAGVPDMAKFQRDLKDPSLAATVQTDKQQAINLGLTGVPTFFVGQRPIQGAQPTNVFEQVIDQALKDAGH